MEYENHELCRKLEYGTLCFWAMRYSQGKFEEVTHEHGPAHRISTDYATGVLRSLVARFSEWPGQYIVWSHLNERGGGPECYPGFRCNTTYPEPGAMRQYVTSPTVTAWYDSVVSKPRFRPAATE